MNEIVTDDQKQQIMDTLTSVFSGVIDLLYTIVVILVEFFTQPEVLGALAVITIVFLAYGLLRKKRLN